VSWDKKQTVEFIGAAILKGNMIDALQAIFVPAGKRR
jgi:hypothetical protein